MNGLVPAVAIGSVSTSAATALPLRNNRRMPAPAPKTTSRNTPTMIDPGRRRRPCPRRGGPSPPPGRGGGGGAGNVIAPPRSMSQRRRPAGRGLTVTPELAGCRRQDHTSPQTRDGFALDGRLAGRVDQIDAPHRCRRGELTLDQIRAGHRMFNGGSLADG